MPSQAVGAGEGGRGIATRAIKGKSSAGRVQGTSCYPPSVDGCKALRPFQGDATVQLMALDASSASSASSTSSNSRAGAALRGETRVRAVASR